MREGLGVGQRDAVRDWEQHRRAPDAPARTLLGMVDADPKAALDLIARMG